MTVFSAMLESLEQPHATKHWSGCCTWKLRPPMRLA